MISIQPAVFSRVAPVVKFSAQRVYSDSNNRFKSEPTPESKELDKKFPIIQQILDLPIVKTALDFTPAHLGIYFWEMPYGILNIGWVDFKNNKVSGFRMGSNIDFQVQQPVGNDGSVIHNDKAGWAIANVVNNIWQQSGKQSMSTLAGNAQYSSN